MMGFLTTIKSNAKRMLSGIWGRAIGVMLLTGLPVFLLNMLEYGIRQMSGVAEFVDYGATPPMAFDDMANVAAISWVISILIGILVFLVSTPLSQGSARWYYRRTNGGDDGVTELFHYFESAGDYFKSIWLYFSVSLRMFLWMLLLLTPVLVGAGFAGMQFYLGRFPDGVVMIGKILLLIWIVLAVLIGSLIAMRYFLAPYLLAAHPELKSREAIKQSVRMTRGHKGSLFLFQLSFILWYLPMVLALLLLLPAVFSGMYYLYQIIAVVTLLLLVQLGMCFYLNPYMNAAMAVYARYLIQRAEGGEEFLANDTREYDAYKPEIDRYMEQNAQTPPEQDTPVPPHDPDA